MKANAMKETLSVTDALIDKITGTAGDILERRGPGESLPSQMLKSPDVMLVGALAVGVISLAVVPVEVAVDTAIALARFAKSNNRDKPPGQNEM